MYQNSIERMVNVANNISKAIANNIFPVETNNRIIDIEQIHPSIDLTNLINLNFNISKQLDTKIKGKDLTVPIKGTLVLKDKKTNKVIDRKKVTLVDSPVLTNRGSFIYGGNEYHIVNQLRLKPGIYTRIKDNGEIESFFNLSKGGSAGFSIWMNPESGGLKFKIGGKNPEMYALMKALDVSDKDMEAAWGKELFEINKIEDSSKLNKEIEKIYSALYRSKAEPNLTLQQKKERIKEYFNNTGLSEETTKITLNKPFNKVTPEALLRASSKLIKVSRKEDEPDERDSLVFKNAYTIEDLLQERLKGTAKEIQWKIKNNLNTKDDIKNIYSKDILNKQIKSFITQSNLSTGSDQTNPVAMMNALTRTTLMGEGGLSSLDIVTNSMRAVSPSHVGVLDPSQTPESKRIGINLNLASKAKIKNKEIYSKVYDPKTDAELEVTRLDIYDKKVAFPDQYDFKNKKYRYPKIRVIYRGKFTEVNPSEVDYIIPRSSDLFSHSSNLVPFQANVQGNRMMMANKMLGQAVSLVHREAPLVQVKTYKSDKSSTTQEQLASKVFAIKALKDGEIISINDDYAVLRPDDGGPDIKIYKYNYFPLANKGHLHSEFIVKPGDKVKMGQIIAEDNFTKNGTLALGTNLNIAYLPFKENTFEDGFVVSESAARKLTSEHMYTYKVVVNEKDKLGIETYKQHYPSNINIEQQKNLDRDGVIKEGSTVHPGDILVALLSYREPTETDIALGKLSKTLLTKYRDGAVIYDHDTVGKVVRVVRNGDEITIHVRTEKPLVEGDKIVGRYGNKGIVTKILPDDEMPVNEDGIKADVIMSPYGVPGRINVGQIFETIAAKAALKKGAPIKITNMPDDFKSTEELEKLAKKYNIKTEEKLYDPKTGRLLAKTSFGPQYILKLVHMVEKKMSSRGPYAAYNSDEQPAKGGETSARSLDRLTWNALIAHGARENLREMATYKANKNPELWNRVRLGLPLPTPKTPFATSKLFDLMQAAGINVKKEGQQMMLVPLTDDEVLAKSNGEIDDAQVIMAKTLRPIKDGLFDDKKTGGLNGAKWTHITLAEPIVSPIMAPAAMTVLGLSNKDFNDILHGDTYVDVHTKKISKEFAPGLLTGGEAIRELLKQIDPKKELVKLKEEAKGLSADKLDQVNKRMRYLRALDMAGLSPDKAYVINTIPVVPPKIRPIYSLPDGSLSTSPINFLYRDLIMVNKELKDSSDLPEFMKKKLRLDLNKAVEAVQGLGNPIVKRGEKKIVGALEMIKGDQPKTGYFQAVVFTKKQELSGQSTAAPSVDVSPDEVLLPKAMAWNLFEPFVHRELINMGYSNMEAKKLIQNRDLKAEQALSRAAEKRMVWVNRAPSLHKLNMLAMRPKIYDGDAIKVNPLIVSGYNLDFDGDSAIISAFAAINMEKIKNFTSSDNFGILDIEEFINQRRIAMPSKEIKMAISQDETVICLNLEDFPRIESSKRVTETGTIVYKVPEGVSIFTLDNETRKFIKVPVTEFSIHPNLNGKIVTTAHHETLVLSDDHSAIVFDFKTGKLTKCRPDDLIGKAIPRSRTCYTKALSSNSYITEIKLTDFSEGRGRNLVKSKVPLDQSLGYFIGIMVGDGWVSKDSQERECLDRMICIANVEPEIAKAFETGVNSLCTTDKFMYSIPSPHKYKGYKCYSEKHTISNASLAGNIVEWIGKGAENKHLPFWYLNTPKEFRLGLLSGLIDTDGSACWVTAQAKKTKQFQLSFHTMSIRLAYEVVILARSLGVTAKIVPYKNKYYNVNFYNRDLYKQQLPLNLKHAKNKAAYQEFLATIPSKNSVDKFYRTDLVPFGQIIFERVKKFLPGATRKKNRDPEQFCLYNTMKKALKTGCITRNSAKNILQLVKGDPDVIPAFWRELVLDESISWTYAVSVKALPKKETMYDITAPGPYTFMDINGLIVQDTLGIYVPVSDKAIEESKQFMPSKVLEDPRDYSITLTPTHDIQLGLFALSAKGGKRTGEQFSSLREAEIAFLRNQINLNDVIKINGYETTFGREKLKEILPKDISIPEEGITKKNLNAFLEEIAIKHKSEVNKILSDLTRLSALYNSSSGIGITLSDLKSDNDFMKPFKDKIKKEFYKIKDKKEQVNYLSNMIANFSKKSSDWVKKNVWNNNLAVMSVAAGKPQVAQVKQLKFAPLVVMDENNKIIPTPITRSYSEGVKASDFWLASHGARKGMIDRQLQTAEPGYFAKQLISVTINQVITKHDCGTTNGITLSLDRDKIDILWRFDTKGNLIDNNRYESLLRAGVKFIKVRSPITCEAEDGICQLCYGAKPNGQLVEIGTNVGAEAGQVATERTTQLTMKTFHTGAVATSGPTIASGFERIQQLSHFPEFIKDRATLARLDGKITAIKPNPAGGVNVWVNDEKHYCPVTELKVRVGDIVKKGEPLTEGTIKPQELLATKGIRAVQDFLIDEMNNTFRNQGINLNRRAFETVVRATTNVTKIIDPANHPEYLPGDKVELTKVLAYNRMNPNNPIKHEPELLGIDFSSKISRDWAAKMNTNRIKAVLQDAVAAGDISSVHSYNPLAPYIIGAEFGKGESGKY